ncbi:MAG: hypothetical protein M3Y12_14970 [Bacteroidota bacterium]|nr:hypothetical protein [Bacteroidota bacterium]
MAVPFFLLLLFFGFKTSALAGLLLLATAFAHAQAPTPLPTHAVRSIDPTNTDFRDLAFLKVNAELRKYRPMGRAMKAAPESDQVYILGTLSGGGTQLLSTRTFYFCGP